VQIKSIQALQEIRGSKTAPESWCKAADDALRYYQSSQAAIKKAFNGTVAAGRMTETARKKWTEIASDLEMVNHR